MNENNKCSHEMCHCQVGEDTTYCSDHCKDAVDQDLTEIKCDCGHPSCE